jgi:hypothetical protein
MVTSSAPKGTTMPPPTLQVTLDRDAQAELDRLYHSTRDACLVGLSPFLLSPERSSRLPLSRQQAKV